MPMVPGNVFPAFSDAIDQRDAGQVLTPEQERLLTTYGCSLEPAAQARAEAADQDELGDLLERFPILPPRIRRRG